MTCKHCEPACDEGKCEVTPFDYTFCECKCHSLY